MSRAEVAIVVAVLLCAFGVGLWIHPGAGVLIAGLGIGLWGALEIRFPAETRTDEGEPAAAEEPAA